METKEQSAQHWETLAEKEERWAQFIRSGKATHAPYLPHDPIFHEKLAKQYRNVALSIRLEEQHGEPYCSCTTPPHKLSDIKQNINRFWR